MSEHCEHAWVGDSECAYCEIVRLRDLIRTHRPRESEMTRSAKGYAAYESVQNAF